VAQDSVEAGPIFAPAAPDAGDLRQTLNFALPNHWLAPGTGYSLELDPDNALPERDEANNRFPAGGAQSFNFTNAPALDVTLVPISYRGRTPNLTDLSYLTWFPERVYPVAIINYAVRPVPLVFDGDLRTGAGWSSLLLAVTSLHAQPGEDPQEQRVYYGVVDSVAADGCGPGGCIVGTAWVNGPGRYLSKTAVGFAGFPSDRAQASFTFAHEMGHNFGRYHAPCPASLDEDDGYPYVDAAIGQWGYDIVAGTLLSPSSYRDFMSYCSPEWVSDYTFHGLFQAWGWASQPFGPAAALQPAADAWLVSGTLSPAGDVSLQPVVRGPGRAAAAAGEPGFALSAGGGSQQNPAYALEVLDAAGRVVARQGFTPVPIAIDGTQDSAQLWGFQVALPGELGLAGLRVTAGERTLLEQAVTVRDFSLP
jgi:hypothetical protein